MPNIADDILATLQRIEALLKRQALNANGICGYTATINHDKYLGLGKSEQSIEVIECTLPINHTGSCNKEGWCFRPGQQINHITEYR